MDVHGDLLLERFVSEIREFDDFWARGRLASARGSRPFAGMTRIRF